MEPHYAEPVASAMSLGRTQQYEQLRALLSAARAGASQSAVITGSSDVGKTQLVSVLSRHARDESVSILSTKAVQHSALEPHSTLRSLCATAGFPLDTDLGTESMASRFNEIVAELTATAPLLVVVRDAHFADLGSLRVLHSLMSETFDRAVLWTVVCDPSAGSTEHQELIASITDEGAVRVHLGALDPECAINMCSVIVDAALDDDLRALALQLAAAPMLLHDVMAVLHRTGRIRTRDGLAHLANTSPPAALQELLRQRAHRGSPTLVTVLEGLSLLESETTVSELARILDSNHNSVSDDIATGLSRGLIVDNDARFRFPHPIFAAAFAQSIDVGRRTRLHSAIAAVGPEFGRSTATVAHHLLQTGDPELLSRAADLICATPCGSHVADPRAYAEVALQALDVLPPGTDGLVPLAVRAVHWLAVIGDIDHAVSVGLSNLHQTMDDADRAELLLWISNACKNAGRNAEVLHYTEIALDLTEDIAAKRRILALRAHAHIARNQFEDAEEAALVATRVADEESPDEAHAFGLTALAIAALSRGNLAEAMEIGKRAADLTLTGPGLAHQANIWYARTLVPFDRFAEADQLFASGQNHAAADHRLWSLPMWHYHCADSYWVRGQLARAAEEVTAGLNTAREIGATQLIPASRSLAAQIAMVRGDLDAAGAHIHETRRLIAYEVTVHPSDHIACDVMWALAEGDRYLGATYISDVISDQRKFHLVLARDYAVAPLFTRVCHDLGDADRVGQIAATVERLAAQPSAPSSIKGVAAQIRAIAEPSAETISDSLSLLRKSARPGLLAAALDDASEIFGGTKGSRCAREAADLWNVLGVRRADLLRGTHTKGGGSDQSLLAQDGIGSLTAAEDRVVSLIVQGRTNREVAAELFLSRHTVDSHLRSAFTKAAVNSRVELTRWYLDRKQQS